MNKIRSRIYIVIISILVLAFCASCQLENFSGFFSSDGAKIRMISIGMDYQNSAAASTLNGTIDDAYEMAASLYSIMDGNGIDMETVFLIQEGYEYLLEVKCNSSYIVKDIEKLISGTSPTPSSVKTSYDGAENCTIRAYVDSTTTADTLKANIESLYPSNATVSYASIRNTSSYPSKANIIKEINACSDLEENDLLIVYYSGHGQAYNVISSTDLNSILYPYLEEGKITQEQYDALMALEIKDATEILNAMSISKVDTAVQEEIYQMAVQYIVSVINIKGALITAPYYDYEYYDLLDMERVYTLLSNLSCKVVFIVDACYSGFASKTSFSGVSLNSAISSFMQSETYPNVIVMSASSPTETSKVSAVMTEDKEIQRHSMFTINILEQFNWVHSSLKNVYMNAPFYSLNSDGTVNESTEIREINGYMSSLPLRSTAIEVFDRAVENWNGIQQTPQHNECGYDICLIP